MSQPKRVLKLALIRAFPTKAQYMHAGVLKELPATTVISGEGVALWAGCKNGVLKELPASTVISGEGVALWAGCKNRPRTGLQTEQK